MYRKRKEKDRSNNNAGPVLYAGSASSRPPFKFFSQKIRFSFVFAFAIFPHRAVALWTTPSLFTTTSAPSGQTSSLSGSMAETSTLLMSLHRHVICRKSALI
jgi:hypothetical protein